MWFEFLKLADPQKCADSVKEDFGNVWETDFETWWQDHRHLFEPEAPLTIQKIENIDDYKDYETDDDSLIIVIPLLAPKMHLQKEFEKLMREWHPSKKGRPKYDDLAARYSLCSRPFVHGLEQTLKVYNFKQLHPTMTGMQIEEKLKLINKTGKNAGKIWKKSTKPKELERMWNIQRSTVSRYLRQADKLIENVAKGIFPLNK